MQVGIGRDVLMPFWCLSEFRFINAPIGHCIYPDTFRPDRQIPLEKKRGENVQLFFY